MLGMLMGGGHSLLSIASRLYPGIQTWADIAEEVGARREDFDRVRHAASWMQQTLPQKKARGEFWLRVWNKTRDVDVCRDLRIHYTLKPFSRR